LPEVLVATPLKSSDATRPYTFGDGISVRELAPILWDISIAKTFISPHEQNELANTRYWLCASKEVDHVYGNVGDDLYPHAAYAMWALQTICPSGAKNLYLKFAHTEKGYDNIDSSRPKELCSTVIGRTRCLEDRGFPQDFEAIYTTIKRAFTEKIVRLQNPVLLLEHGMQIGNVNLGTLMFVMGLDMLMMTGEKVPFIERLGGFLGPQSYVFPPDSFIQRQPSTRVQEVLADLYEFRNIIAHGQEIPRKPYRQTYELLDDQGMRINHDDLYYAELMLESGVFLLTQALRKICLEGLFDDLCDKGKWRGKLRLYEHRWKNTTANGGR
jgi:hypothetical protein